MVEATGAQGTGGQATGGQGTGGQGTRDQATGGQAAGGEAVPGRIRLPRVVAVVGPTAVGKSALAMALAGDLGGEIVSLDSRQIYRGLDIGTAKPTADERARVPHHLLDIAAPDVAIDLADVQSLALGAIAGAAARARLPLLVGGTGQYVRAVLEGWQIPPVPPDPALRGELAAFAAAHGPDALHARLQAVDPVAAGRIDARNVRRVVRALEVHRHTGTPSATARPRRAPAFESLRIGLTRPRPDLYARIDRRVDAMLAAGLEAEVRGLVARGYGFDLPAMSGVGYGEWAGLLAGEIDRDEVVRRIRRHTRRLVRSQMTWFRLDDPRIHWFDLECTAPGDIHDVVAAFVA